MLHDTMLPSQCRLCSRSQLATRLTSLIMMKRHRPLAGQVCGPRRKNGEGRKRCNLLCARGIGSANLWLLHTRAHSTGHAPDDKPASDHVTPGSGGRAHECIVTSLAPFPPCTSLGAGGKCVVSMRNAVTCPAGLLRIPSRPRPPSPLCLKISALGLRKPCAMHSTNPRAGTAWREEE